MFTAAVLFSPLSFVSKAVPAELQWLTLLLAVVGFPLAVMGIMTVPQLLWGGPRLALRVTDRRIRGGRGLLISVINYPEHRPILRHLVRREDAKDVIADYEISEVGTGKIVASGMVELQEGAIDGRATIPASVLGVTAIIVRRDSDNDPILIAKSDTEVLPEGQYVCRFQAFNGVLKTECSQTFKAGTTVDELYWLS